MPRALAQKEARLRQLALGANRFVRVLCRRFSLCVTPCQDRCLPRLKGEKKKAKPKAGRAPDPLPPACCFLGSPSFPNALLGRSGKAELHRGAAMESVRGGITAPQAAKPPGACTKYEFKSVPCALPSPLPRQRLPAVLQTRGRSLLLLLHHPPKNTSGRAPRPLSGVAFATTARVRLQKPPPASRYGQGRLRAAVRSSLGGSETPRARAGDSEEAPCGLYSCLGWPPAAAFLWESLRGCGDRGSSCCLDDFPSFFSPAASGLLPSEVGLLWHLSSQPFLVTVLPSHGCNLNTRKVGRVGFCCCCWFFVCFLFVFCLFCFFFRVPLLPTCLLPQNYSRGILRRPKPSSRPYDLTGSSPGTGTRSLRGFGDPSAPRAFAARPMRLPPGCRSSAAR